MDSLFQTTRHSKELAEFHDPENHIRGQVDGNGLWQGQISFYKSEEDNHPYKIAKYEDGELHGRTLTFEPNDLGIHRISSGVTYFKGSIVDSELYKNGALVESYENEVNGRKQGILWKFEDGRPIERGFYSNGKKEGTTTFYYPSGTIKSEIDYSKNVPHGIEQQFDEQGRQILYREWERGDQQGSQIRYEQRDGYGQVEIHSTFIHGIEIGPYKVISNEDVLETGNIQFGRKNGITETFEGQILTSRINYKDDVAHGSGQYFHADYMERGNFVNGKREGTWECVNLRVNKVFMHKTFQAGEAVRYARINKEGHVSKEGIYKNGVPVMPNAKPKIGTAQIDTQEIKSKGVTY